MTRWRWYCFLLNYDSPQLGLVFEMCISLQFWTISSDVYKQNTRILYQILQMQYIPAEVINGFHEG